MANGLSGDISMKLNFNVKSAIQSLQHFQQTLKSSFGKNATQGLENSVKNVEQSIKDTEKSVKQLETSLEKTKAKLKELSESDTPPKSVIAMEKELDRTTKKIADLQKQFDNAATRATDAYNKMNTNYVAQRSMGYSNEQAWANIAVQVDAVKIAEAEVERLQGELYSAKHASEELSKRLAEVKADPTTSNEYKKLTADIQDTTTKLDEQKAKLAELKAEQDNTANNAILNNSRIASSYNPITSAINRVGRMLKRVFVFSVFTSGLRDLRTGIANLIMSNSQLSSSLATIKGNLLTAFAPIWQTILPYLQTFMQVLAQVTAYIANFVSTLFGKSVKASQSAAKAMYTQASAAKSAGKATKQAAKDTKDAAKEVERSTYAFDELNQLQNTKDTSDGGTDTSDGGTDTSDGGGIVPSFNSSDLAVSDEMEKKLKNILDLVKLIGKAFIFWKITQFVQQIDTALKTLQTITGLSKVVSVAFTIIGFSFFLDAWDKMKTAIKDIKENGPNFDNVTLLLESFAEGIGGVMLALGKIETGAAFLLISSVVGLVKDIKDIAENGPNWDNVTSMIDHLLVMAASIALLMGYTCIGAVIIVIDTIVKIIKILHDNWDAIKNGDWSGVDKAELITLVITALAGIAIAIVNFAKKLKGHKTVTQEEMKPLEDSVGNINEGYGSISLRLVSLAKNIAIGILIIAEVAIGLGLFLAAIWGMGELLQQIIVAWQPVLDNGGTVGEALGYGTVLLVAVGAACAGLGYATIASGGTIAVAIGIGAAVLLEIGDATDKFLGEISGVAQGLQQINTAWQPVLDNGDTVAQGLTKGTELLTAVGAACAALGAITIASVGLLPVAIALGTKMLKKIGGAFTQFTTQVTTVARQIQYKLYPALNGINDILPDTQKYLNKFMSFMKTLGNTIVKFYKNTKDFNDDVKKLISNFKENPVQALADDVADQKSQTDALNANLQQANPELELCIDLITTYYGFLRKIEDLTCVHSNINLQEGMFTDMKKVGENLVLGFVAGIKSKYTELDNAIKEAFGKIISYVDGEFTTNWNSSWSTVLSALDTKLTTELPPLLRKGLDLNGYADIEARFKSWGITLGAKFLKGLEQRLDIHSPSRAVRDEVAANVVKGFAIGILKNEDEIIDAYDKLVSDTHEKVSEITNDSNKVLLESEQRYIDESNRLKGTQNQAELDYLETLRVTSEEEHELYIQKQQNIATLKTNVVNTYKDLTTSALKSIEELEDKQNNFADKLYNYQSLTTTTKDKNGNEVLSLANLDEQIKFLEGYEDSLLQIQEMENVPAEFFEMIRDMSVEEGADYANALLNLSDEDFDKYIEDWKTKQEVSKRISKELYKNEADELSTEIDNQFEDVEKEFFDVGVTAGEEFDDGFISSLSSTVDDAITLIKTRFGGLFSTRSAINSPFIGGTKLTSALATSMTGVNVPALASGAVLPPNHPFLSIVSDQKHGTNIEAPLSTIQEAVSAELDKRQFSNNAAENITVVLAVDERELGSVVLKASDLERARSGNNFIGTTVTFGSGR